MLIRVFIYVTNRGNVSAHKIERPLKPDEILMRTIDFEVNDNQLRKPHEPTFKKLYVRDNEKMESVLSRLQSYA